VKKTFKIVTIIAVILTIAFFCFRFYRLHSVPSAALACLRAPQQMTLYSIQPHFANADTPSTNLFHGNPILGEVAIAARADQRTVATDLERGITFWVGDRMACFEPRHGVRVTDGDVTYDFLICFECMTVVVYSDDEPIGSIGITRSPNTLNELLSRSDVPLATH
jgi:hypothetical protein